MVLDAAGVEALLNSTLCLGCREFGWRVRRRYSIEKRFSSKGWCASYRQYRGTDMEEDGLTAGEIFQLLDEAGLTWLTDEIRSWRSTGGEQSISADEVRRSRRSYNSERGETPFAEVKDYNAWGIREPLAGSDYVGYVVERLKATAGQLEAARTDAAHLGLGRIQLGLETQPEGGIERVIEALKNVERSFRGDVE